MGISITCATGEIMRTTLLGLVLMQNALKAMAALRRSDPALVQWLMDGHPRLTEAAHSERFGKPYKAHRARKSSFVQSDRKGAV